MVSVFRFNDDGMQLIIDMILEITQLCCFPFAVDANEELLMEIQQWVENGVV